MPEVISLLSSPEAPAVPARKDGPDPRSALPGPPAHGLGYGSDLVDLTDDTPLPERFRGTSAVAPPKRRGNEISGVGPNGFFLSDDFDSSIDLGNDVGSATGGHAAKRARISPSSAQNLPKRDLGQSRSVADKATRPSVLQATNMKRWNSALDPIEYTSSPDVVPASSAKAAIVYDDPFASSPSPRIKENIPPKPITQPSLGDKFSDFEDPFRSSPPQRAASPPRRPSPKHTSATWDPISSSAPELTSKNEEKEPEDPWDKPLLPPRNFAKCQSETIDISDSDDCKMSDDSLPNLCDLDFSKLPARANRQLSRVNSTGKKTSSSSARSKATSGSSWSRPAKSSATGTGAKASKSAAISVEKDRERAEKAAAREAEKERKKIEREQKAREKERAAALAEVNKIKTDKKQSTPEMIVDFPQGMNPTIQLQAETLLKDLGVEHTKWTSPVNNVVKWRRKVKARYDPELGQWEPIPPRVESEQHALVLLTASEFVELALASGSQPGDAPGAPGALGEAADTSDGVDGHIGRMQASFPDHTFIYLIEGLGAWMRKNRNIRNRQFAAAVRGLADPGVAVADASAPPPPSSQRRRRKPAPAYVDEDIIEDALLNLQVVHGALIHHTALPIESAQWITVFTQHISTIPYRRVRDQTNDSAAFCMDTGQVRSGDGAADTYVRMLQEIVRVTAPIAHGIAAEFPSVPALVGGVEAGGPLALQDVRKSANRDGAPSDRAIGPAVSRRIYKVFTGRDERSTDV